MCRTRRSSAFRLAAGRRNARAGAAPSSSRETTCLNDAHPTYRSDIPLRQQPRDLSQERDRWFESGSLQQRVRLSPDFAYVPGKARIFRQLGDHAGWQRRQRRAKPRNNEPRSGSVSVERYSSTAVLLAAVRDIGGAGRKRDRLPRGKRCRWSFELGSAQAKPSTVRCSCQASGRCECASSLSAVRPRGSRRRGWLA